jgi:hypothetical protein
MRAYGIKTSEPGAYEEVNEILDGMRKVDEQHARVEDEVYASDCENTAGDDEKRSRWNARYSSVDEEECNSDIETRRDAVGEQQDASGSDIVSCRGNSFSSPDSPLFSSPRFDKRKSKNMELQYASDVEDVASNGSARDSDSASSGDLIGEDWIGSDVCSVKGGERRVGSDVCSVRSRSDDGSGTDGSFGDGFGESDDEEDD